MEDNVTRRSYLTSAALALVLLGLPLAVWLDLIGHSDRMLRQQADDLTTVITAMRRYYSVNVVDRVLAAPGAAEPRHDYTGHLGAIPIPATLSIELGTMIGGLTGNVGYRFVSDYPFRNRGAHDLTPVETGALAGFRDSRDRGARQFVSGGGIWRRQAMMLTPVVMDAGCVACHNAHPLSPRRDWSVGDVRGLQVVSVSKAIGSGLGSFRWLLGYFLLAGTVATLISVRQIRLAGSFARLSGELADRNATLDGISRRLSRYLPSQVAQRIAAGDQSVTVSAQRRKLTIFMSDIVDFTAATDRMQPEEITALLNEYFGEMVRIAERHGATVDKFVGDALVVFFGDPETRGVAEDARACVAMALEMQARLRQMQPVWRERGIEHPFQVRMGINTGFCNVGNFGTPERMDYTIIGAEVNLTERLQRLAPPGGLVLAFQTMAHVRDMVVAEPMEMIAVRGILWPVIPYRVEMPEPAPTTGGPIQNAATGVLLRLDPGAMDAAARDHARRLLREALNRLGAS